MTGHGADLLGDGDGELSVCQLGADAVQLGIVLERGLDVYSLAWPGSQSSLQEGTLCFSTHELTGFASGNLIMGRGEVS